MPFVRIRLAGDQAQVLHDGRAGMAYSTVLQNVQARRAAWVEPASGGLRLVFHLLRWLFGDQGRVATWTRRWPCRWQVDLRPVGGASGSSTFLTRDAALAYEADYVAERLGFTGSPVVSSDPARD